MTVPDLASAAPAVLAFAGGVLLAAFHFGGLWLTVRRIRNARHPHLRVAASSLARTVVTVGALFLITGGRPLRLAAALVGFLLGRTVLVRILGAPGPREATARDAVSSGEA